MIISHEHRYVFVEIPLTASWSLAQELRAHYGGHDVLHKHATYQALQRSEYPSRGYFVFAGVRNPLDVLVSRYTKLGETQRHRVEARTVGTFADFSDLKRARVVRSTDAGFPPYLRRFHRRPFSEMIDLSRRHLDFVIRYEHLQADFSEVLARIGLSQVRPLPVTNPTPGKTKAYLSMYPPDLVAHAQSVCGPFMQRWGYDFPPDWPAHVPSALDELRYRTYGLARAIYIRHLRYHEGRMSRVLRATIARVFG